jgi:hypothetical protein
MDTTEPGQQHLDGAAVLPVRQAQGDEFDSIRAFERFVQSRFSCPAADNEFWAEIAGCVERTERTMDAEQVRRFEIAVDYFLTMHGLPSWTVVRQQHSGEAADSEPSG